MQSLCKRNSPERFLKRQHKPANGFMNQKTYVELHTEEGGWCRASFVHGCRDPPAACRTTAGCDWGLDDLQSLLSPAILGFSCPGSTNISGKFSRGGQPSKANRFDKFERKAVACGMHEVVGMTVLGITKFMILQSLWWLVNIERSKRIHWRRDVWKHKTC